MHRIVILLCFILLPYTFIGQNASIKDSLSMYKSKGDTFVYTNIDSCEYYFNKAIRISINNEDWENVIESYFSINNSALNHNDFYRLNNNLKIADSIITKNVFFKQSTDSLYFKNFLSYQKGYSYYKQNQYKRALSSFNTIIKRTETKPDSLLTEDNKYEICSAYSFIASIYEDENKYALANEIYDKCIRFIDSRYNNDLDLLYSIYNLKANILQKEKQYQKSNSFFLKTLNYHESINSKNSIITTNFNIVENYIEQKKLDSANYYLDKLTKGITEKEHFIYLKFDAKSQLFEAKKNYEGALKNSKKYLDFFKTKWTDTPNPEIAKAHTKIGLLHQKFGHLETALKSFDTALKIMREVKLQSTINQTIIFKILKHKTVLLNHLKKYNDAITTANQAITILNHLKSTFKTQTDKLFLQEETYPLFENAIDASYYLFKNSNDNKHLENIFYYFEKSKATLMLEALLSVQANNFYKIPKVLLERDVQLRAQINTIEKNLYKKTKTDLEDQLHILKNEHRTLITYIENNHKEYYDLKYNSNVIDIKTLQNSMDTATTYLSYFYGNSFIYTCSVSKNKVHFNKVTNNKEFEATIKEYRNLLKDPNSSLIKTNNYSYKLYKALIPKNTSTDNAKKLVIIPDGLLNYIPFETLTTLKNKQEYLLKKHTVSYGMSATLLNKLNSKNYKKKKLLAFAPDFKNDSTQIANKVQLLTLPHSKKEVKHIQNYFEGKYYTGPNATLKNFNANSENYGIIHLATHAVINDEFPDFSYLAFTNYPPSQAHLLYANDIYNISTNANMVTLSACQTGIGNLKRGEGAISLARSFFYSGALSITSTLWKINDASASNIMNFYYNNLGNGKNKDQALQLAKIKYLKTNKDTKLSHPYYWSGIIISGSTKPLVATPYWLYTTLILFAFIISFIILKKLI